MIKTDDDRLICDHNEKAAIIWNSYKARIGISDRPTMSFNLDSLISPNTTVNFRSLEEPFTKEEIDGIVNCMPNDRAPGPDGFNGAFLKKCWPIVKENFYNLCEEFHTGTLDL